MERAGCNGSAAVGLPALAQPVQRDWLPRAGDTACLGSTPKCREIRDKLICLSTKAVWSQFRV